MPLDLTTLRLDGFRYRSGQVEQRSRPHDHPLRPSAPGATMRTRTQADETWTGRDNFTGVTMRRVLATLATLALATGITTAPATEADAARRCHTFVYLNDPWAGALYRGAVLAHVRTNSLGGLVLIYKVPRPCRPSAAAG